jgi:hypothetical protein
MVTRAWVIPAAQLIPGSWFEVHTTGAGNWAAAGDQLLVTAQRTNASMTGRYLDLRQSNFQVNAPVGIAVRSYWQVVSPAEIITWHEVLLSPRPSHSQWTGGNMSIGAVANTGPEAITPGADLTIGVTGRWTQNLAAQTLTFFGSRLSRYIATPAAGGRAYDLLTRRPALI